MKAVVFHEFGGPEVLRIEERPRYQPGPEEVVVAVAAATVNPTDLMMLHGIHASVMTDLVPPFIAGMEYSGRVAAIGERVDLSVGTEVLGVVNPRTPRGGAQAQEIVVPATFVAGLATGSNLLSAATVPMNALTAMLALEMLGLLPGQTLLVTGGSGMVGGYAIQLARHAGMIVLANAGEKDRGFLSSIGVDAILPRDEGLEEALRTVCPAGVDGLVDGALIGNKVSRLVRAGGNAVALRRSHPIKDSRLKVGCVSVAAGMGDTRKLARIAGMLEKGVLTPRVAADGVFPFERARDAYQLAERGGFRGRVVLTFDSVRTTPA